MSGTISSKTRRTFLIAGGAVLAGTVALLKRLWPLGQRQPKPSHPKLSSLSAQLRMPGNLGSLMQSFSRDPEKVRRFEELARWREELNRRSRTTS